MLRSRHCAGGAMKMYDHEGLLVRNERNTKKWNGYH
jgi:hypothetical protein